MQLAASKAGGVVILCAALSLATPGQARAQNAPADSASQEQGSLTNPYGSDADVLAEGKKLYMSWNCYGCHGSGGGGGMGPSLIDAEWRYGSDDASVFHSIKDGRPNGMPAWSANLTDDEIWKVIAFLRSLSEANSSAGSGPAPTP